MTHVKYHTEAIVLESAPFQEASKFLKLLTKDFGLIHASVRGVREVTSKLRYSLQDFSYARIDLVTTKHGWKIVSALQIENFCSVREDIKPEYVKMVTRIPQLLKRLVRGEEKS